MFGNFKNIKIDYNLLKGLVMKDIYEREFDKIKYKNPTIKETLVLCEKIDKKIEVAEMYAKDAFYILKRNQYKTKKRLETLKITRETRGKEVKSVIDKINNKPSDKIELNNKEKEVKKSTFTPFYI